MNISGIPNKYLRVDEILTDRVRVSDLWGDQLGDFGPGDIVLLIQMTGTTQYTTGDFMRSGNRTKNSFRETGTFEVLQVDEIVESAGQYYIVFTDDISRTYDNGERIQLVKFSVGETVTTTGSVTAMEWDSAKGTGGIVAIIGTGSVKLNHNIDVSLKGFAGGAVPDENYNGNCRKDPNLIPPNPIILDTLYFLSTQLNRSGNKGEGIITRAWPYTKGKAFNINGGGAGNGKYSGGGGGSNYRTGGDGGQQSNECSETLLGGWGGYACQDLYQYPASPRILMGGGGGSGTKLLGSTASPGADGGGIVVVITDTLIGNNKIISANGGSAAATTGSGGGGGAGGAVILDVTNYSGALNIQIKGGKGGNTNNASDCAGTGGGGSGGVVWHSGTAFSASIDSANGAAGSISVSCASRSGYPGSPGTKLKNLISPLTGFLFNTIRGTDTICAGQVPDLVTGSQPKGGDGIYVYQWEKTTDQINWSAAAGTSNQKTYQSQALSLTTFFRRIVTSAGIADTSKAIEVYVYPAISNNNISGIDTICYNSHAKQIQGLNPNGGDGLSYSYRWQVSNDMSSWTNSSTLLTENNPLDPGVLMESKYFRRLVTSTTYCFDTSNSVKVTVLPLIANNGFVTAGDTAICMNQSPGQLSATVPSGGDGTYDYSWQFKTQTGNWTDIPLSNFLRYNPGVLNDTASYRRIVYSGNDQACIDTSGEVKTVNVMSFITNNAISCDPVRYTCFQTSITLPGSHPANGDGTYDYRWEQSSNNIDWSLIPGADDIDYTTQELTTKQYFRRTVYSSAAIHQCTDISDAVEVKINSLPTGDVISSVDTICRGETTYVKFNVTGNGPFIINIGGVTGSFADSFDSVAFSPAATQTFSTASIRDDSLCYANAGDFTGLARVVVYEVPVANAGSDNEVCGKTYTLNAVKSIAASAGLWSGTAATFNSPVNPGSNVTSDNYGKNVFTWTETNWQCSDEDDVEITMYEQPQSPDAGSDQTLDFVYTTQLQAGIPLTGKGKWTVVTGTAEFDNDTLPDAVVSQLSADNTLKWTVINGTCPEVSDEMAIIITPLSILKGFTPNNDGKNDYFDIGAENAELIKVRIFNSAGILVFGSEDYKEGDYWYGRNMNGVELPEGTYFYIINIKVSGKQDEVQFRSFIEIMR